MLQPTPKNPAASSEVGNLASKTPFGFVPLGIGDLFSKIHYPTSFLLVLGERRLLIDCPTPLPRILHEASVQSGLDVSLDSIDGVILTHLHGDHSSGLECMGFHARFNRNRRVRVWTLEEIARDLWEHRLKAAMGYELNGRYRVQMRYELKDFFDVHRLEPGCPADICGAGIHIRQTRHAPICFGLKVFFEGRSLGFSSDTSFDPDHITFLEECDLIVHETGAGIHTHYESLAALPEETRAKIHLVHIADSFDAATSVMPVLEQGRYYAL